MIIKRTILLILLVFVTTTVSLSQKKKNYFDNGDLFLVGSYYYPEHWLQEQWERDFKKMAELGFHFTHFGEFAWANFEPEEGKFDFSWLDEAIRLASEQNLKIVLCTPTPTPPAWMSVNYPEILMVDDEGITQRHGARQHISWSSDKYREKVAIIVSKMAERYGNDKRIWGWQIDNEPSHYGKPYDYSENASIRFKEWLKVKYKNINDLNAAWGTAFWSQTYNDFDQIRIPNQKELVQQANPHAMLDFKRFTADEAASFVLFQQDLLKKQISPDQWVTTNLMPEYGAVDPLRLKDMDFLTYTKYLVAGYDLGHGEQGFRMGSSTSIGYSNDFFRPITGTTGVMELQPGQVNWGKFNPQTMPGAVRMWMYHVFAGGNKFVCNYRFRQPLIGGEQYHYGIIGTDGVTVSSSGREYQKVIEELELLEKAYKKEKKMPEDHAARRTAILYNPDNRWETEYQPQTNQWSYMNHITKYHKILKSFGAPVDIIDESKDFNQYPVMIAPAYQLLDKNLVLRWKNYVEQGGHLVLTTRSGQKDRSAKLWEQKFAEPIYALAGLSNLSYDHLPENLMAKVAAGKKIYEWNNWADILEPKEGVEVIARYADQFYEGNAAVTKNKLGKGTVTYIGPDTDDGKLEKDILNALYGSAGIKLMDLPEGLTLEWTQGFWIGLNYSSKTQTAPVPVNAKILIGSKTLNPADVVVWME